MEGRIELGDRTLIVEFQVDRHASDRVEIAYQLVERLVLANNTLATAWQTAQRIDGTTAQQLEVHG